MFSCQYTDFFKNWCFSMLQINFNMTIFGYRSRFLTKFSTLLRFSRFYHAKRVSKMIKSKPMNADERIIKYTEFAAEFGKNNNLDMEGRHLNFIQFYCLDIILPVIGLILFIFYILYRFVKFLLRKIFFIFSGKSKIE